MTTVFLVDDHEIVRRGIADLIDRQTDMEVVGEADDTRHGLARIEATAPDIAILDVHLPDGSGIDLCRAVRSALPETRCLILTGYDDDDAAVAAVLAGASGYVLKDIRGLNLLEAIRRIASGHPLISAARVEQVRAQLKEASPSPDTSHPGDGPDLSLRERQILDLITDGLTNREIGERLHLAEKTVKNYISGLLAKLGMTRRSQAAAYRATERARGAAP